MHDSGSVVVGWLTQLAAALSVVGLIAFDGIALVTTNFSATDDANTAASIAADTYKSTHNVQMAYNAAYAQVAKKNESVDAKTFRVEQSDGRITLTLHKAATTLWMYRISFFTKYTQVTATGVGSPSP